MKGLLIKDMKLMLMQKRFLLIIMAVAVCMTLWMKDEAFLMGYLCFVLSIFAVSTISYDEFDNGYSFLFTLPVSRRGYVVEKYLLCLLTALGALGVSVIALSLMGLLRPVASIPELLISAVGLLLSVTVFLSFMLPIQLKFGAEKGRIMTLCLCGLLAVILFGGGRLLVWLGVDLAPWVGRLLSVSPLLLMGGAGIGVILFLLLSVWISIRIMSKKEF